MVNFGPLTAEIDWQVLGTPANFNRFRVEQRAPPIFGKAAITLGIGPHSSCMCGAELSWHSSNEGITTLDGKRPDGLTLTPWQGGKSLTWDVTVVSTLADSYLHASSHSAGGAAEIASVTKESKCSLIPPDYIFQPVAFETLSLLYSSGYDFFCEVGRRLSAVSGDPREASFLFQLLSVLSCTWVTFT